VETLGQHLILDVFDCSQEILNSETRLKELLTESAKVAGMKILSTHFHSFSPQGVTGVLILSTSHCSIHTWPENGYAAIDLYTCGNADVWPSLENTVRQLGAKSAHIYDLSRGQKKETSQVIRKMIFSPVSGSDSSPI
jgi:S-adenosylmethionine decarboxylase proenzyme